MILSRPLKTFVIKDREIQSDGQSFANPNFRNHGGESTDSKIGCCQTGLAPSKLYYHFGLLEKHGLIEVVEMRTVANMIEKLYQATASELSVEHGLLSVSIVEGKDSVNSMIAATIDITAQISRAVSRRVISSWSMVPCRIPARS